MKKILFAILSAILVFTLVLPLAASAVDGEETETPAETEEYIDVGDEEGVEATLLDRLWEAFTSEKNGILDRSIDIVILVAFAVMAKIASSLKNKVSTDIVSLGAKTDAQATSQDGFNTKFVEAINTVADELKALETKLNNVIQDEHAVASLVTEVTTVLEILTTIYPNAKLPQGIKDIVAEKYANCLKIVNSDDKLGAILNVIHGESNEVISNDGNNEEQAT